MFVQKVRCKITTVTSPEKVKAGSANERALIGSDTKMSICGAAAMVLGAKNSFLFDFFESRARVGSHLHWCTKRNVPASGCVPQVPNGIIPHRHNMSVQQSSVAHRHVIPTH